MNIEADGNNIRLGELASNIRGGYLLSYVYMFHGLQMVVLEVHILFELGMQKLTHQLTDTLIAFVH